jgi:hypothetical protein
VAVETGSGSVWSVTVRIRLFGGLENDLSAKGEYIHYGMQTLIRARHNPIRDISHIHNRRPIHQGRGQMPISAVIPETLIRQSSGTTA